MAGFECRFRGMSIIDNFLNKMSIMKILTIYILISILYQFILFILMMLTLIIISYTMKIMIMII